MMKKNRLLLNEINYKRILFMTIAEIGGESLSGTGASHDMRPNRREQN